MSVWGIGMQMSIVFACPCAFQGESTSGVSGGRTDICFYKMLHNMLGYSRILYIKGQGNSLMSCQLSM